MNDNHDINVATPGTPLLIVSAKGRLKRVLTDEMPSSINYLPGEEPATHLDTSKTRARPRALAVALAGMVVLAFLLLQAAGH